jgi:hypothetical protein
VLIITGEDDIARTVRPRLDACGADCTRIKAVQLVERRKLTDDGRKTVEVRGFNLQEDIQLIERELDHCNNPRVVILDTLDCFLGSTDSHRTADVRGVLAPLAEMASRRRVTIIAIQHLRKQESHNAMYRLSGSLAFIGQARAAWLCCRDPKDESRRLFLLLKSNLGPEVAGLSYTIETRNEVPCIAWGEAVNISASDALRPPRKTARDDATEWLREQLSFGPVSAKAILQLAKNDGIAVKTLYRAKDELDVRSKKDGMGGWLWLLPTPSPEDGHEDPQHTQVAMLTTFEDGQGDHLPPAPEDGQDGQDSVLGIFGGDVTIFDADDSDRRETEARVDVEREAEGRDESP